MTVKVTWDTTDNERDSMCLDEVRELIKQEEDENRLLDRFLEVIRRAVPPNLDDLVYVPDEVAEDDVADWLSDEYGWLVDGWSKQPEPPPALLKEVIYEIKKGRSAGVSAQNNIGIIWEVTTMSLESEQDETPATAAAGEQRSNEL